MDEKKISFNDLLRGLSENFGSIYYVDFDENRVVPYRMNEVIEERFGDYFRSGPTYENAIDGYIRQVVSPKDQEDMYRVTRYEFLKEQLRNERAYSHEYRLERGGREYVFQFKVANLEGIGELHKAVMGFADVSTEKVSDIIYYQHGGKILNVDDLQKNRTELEKILKEKYEVISVSNGKEALEALDREGETIAAVITAIAMPEMDGYELIKQMKKIRRYETIPILAVGGEEGRGEAADDEAEVICLQLGAADVISRPYNPDILFSRLSSAIKLRESAMLLRSLERDSLTGLYAKEFFYQQTERYLAGHAKQEHIMWVTDIEGLKLINDNHGIEVGDAVLKSLAKAIMQMEGCLIGGRIEGDKFAFLLLESVFEAFKRREERPDFGVEFPISQVVIKSGVYRIYAQLTMKAQGMYDRALLAAQKIKADYGVYLAEYDDEMRNHLLVQRMVIDHAEIGLQERQFLVYYQPKHDLKSNKTGGAEALIRWIHPELGFMNPGVFIPIFEKSGFIRKLDYYVWEEVCRSMKRWKENNQRVVPISVNVSRRDFDDENLAENIISLVDRYELDHSLFHVEVTESSYSDNPQLVVETMEKLHQSGFVIELDDFGSGYSSMVALTEIPIDILKLDMSIVRNDKPESDRSVLPVTMKLAQMMNFQTVAEGVETAGQVKRIRSLHGNYIQGYYFSKPLPREEFEQYLNSEN